MRNYILSFIIIFLSCKPDENSPQINAPVVKENTPSVVTKGYSEITINSVKLSGEVTNEGFAATTDRGFVFSNINAIPSVSDSKIQSGYGSGAYSILVDKLTVFTKYYFRAYATNLKGTAYGEIQNFNTSDFPRDTKTMIVDVKSKTGRTWMDRNLGATQTATNSNDEKSIGDLYQWGRETDGHQLRNSETITITSSKDSPGHGNYITSIYDRDWRQPQNDNLWQGLNGVNNPCPRGYRIPTADEWNLERVTWVSNNSSGAFASPLKLPSAGYRVGANVFLTEGSYWSSSSGSGTSLNVLSTYLYFDKSTARLFDKRRFEANSVRCIKE